MQRIDDVVEDSDVATARAPNGTRPARRLTDAEGETETPDRSSVDRHRKRRLVVVSNRLPVQIEKTGDSIQLSPGAGGLITALAPLMERHRGIWVGWPGTDEGPKAGKLLAEWSAGHRYDLAPVFLSAAEVAGYYRGFANQAIWPLFHDFLGKSNFEREHWAAYDAVNGRFATEVRRIVQPDDYVWVHDYQLMLVGHHLRRLGVQQQLGYFLHIPFPASDLFRRIPWKEEILRALLDYDLLGFQTARDRSNFVRSVREVLPNAVVTAKGRQTTIQHEGREITAGHFPISIDFREFYDMARTSEAANAAAHLREEYKCDQMILGVDRLDYTKGVGERYLALAQSLEDHPELIGKISLIQLVIPSRTRLPDYREQKAHVDELAGRINGRFSRNGWVPIHYMYRTLDRTSLVALYRACDIALITPLRDGMNLVAKEYCACSTDGNGVLILSEFAGSAEQLGEQSLLVNPYDREGIADAINEAYHMPRVERRRRMRLLQAEIRRNDVHRWLRWILEPALVG